MFKSIIFKKEYYIVASPCEMKEYLEFRCYIVIFASLFVLTCYMLVKRKCG